MNENNVPGSIKSEVELLKLALTNARKILIEQSMRIDQLTSPPFIYATVVALSGWRDNKTSERITFTDTLGERVIVETKNKTLSIFHLGDVLSLIDKENDEKIIDLIKQAKKLVIVGFTNENKVVIQIDDNLVVVDYPKEVSRTFHVVEIGRIGMVDTAVINVENVYYEVIIPKDIIIKPGDCITIEKETMQIVGVGNVAIAGEVGYVNSIINEFFVEIEYQSINKVVFSGSFSNLLEKGDRIVLDQTSSVIIHNLGKEDDRFKFTAQTNITWDDISGLENAKEQMIGAIELPYQNPDIVEYYHKKPVKGVLLYGPPGCGKTLLGKAIANAIKKINSKDTKGNGFIYIKGPEILERYVGVAESVIRQIFQRARKHKKDFGFPAVIFIDEAEALLSKRGSGISSDIEKTIVPMFCTEMDGLEDSGALVLLATNRPDILDPAIIRDGRIDLKLKIERPTFKSTIDIFLLNLKGVPINNGTSYKELAELGSTEMFKANRVLYKIQTSKKGTIDFSLRDIINGGMVADIVQKAISIAINRDLSTKQKKGLRQEDIVFAIDLVTKQNRDLNHTDELSDFIHDFKDDVMNIQRLCQSTG